MAISANLETEVSAGHSCSFENKAEFAVHKLLETIS